MDHEIIGKIKALAFLDDFKARVKLEQVVAAAGPTPSPADEELEEWLDLWGKEGAEAYREALINAMKEAAPDRVDEEPKSLTSSAEVIQALVAATSRAQRVATRCLDEGEKKTLQKYMPAWIKSVEAPLENVVLDTYNNALKKAGLSEIKTTWGVYPPEDVYNPDDLDDELQRRTQEARTLTADEKRTALTKANQDIEYYSEQAEYYTGVVERDEFEDEDARTYARSLLRRLRELAGLDFDPSISQDSPGYSVYNFTEDGRFYYTRANRIISEETGILNGKLEEIERDIEKRKRQRKALDQKNLKDYDKLDNVFQFGHYGGRGYTYYRRARYWRELHGRGEPGGFRTVTTTQAPLTSIVDDIDTIFSKSKTVGEADRAVSLERVERFLRSNVPEPNDTKIRSLMRDKAFLKALGNRSILATEVKSEGIGVRGLSGFQLRGITDRGVELARMTVPGMIRELDDLMCQGKTFRQALDTLQDRQIRIMKDVSNSVMNDTLLQIANDPYLNDPNGTPPTKVWITARINSRQDHIDADGQPRAINDFFDVGGEKGSRPLSLDFSAKNTANCRCRMRIVAYHPNGEPVGGLDDEGNPVGITLVDSQFFE